MWTCVSPPSSLYPDIIDKALHYIYCPLFARTGPMVSPAPWATPTFNALVAGNLLLWWWRDRSPSHGSTLPLFPCIWC